MVDDKQFRTNSYILNFKNEDDLQTLYMRLHSVTDLNFVLSPLKWGVKLPMSMDELLYICRDLNINITIKRIQDLELLDLRSDSEKLDALLDRISEFGFDMLTIEERLELDILSKL
jgi:hypothetical protein